jgi:hypothetical protein
MGEIFGRVAMIEERLTRIEGALAKVQRDLGYFGLCVNHSLHPGRQHPHWDDL